MIILIFSQENKERQGVYIKYSYDSLSSRFQISENLKSARLMLMLSGEMVVVFSFIFALDFMANNYRRKYYYAQIAFKVCLFIIARKSETN